ncbi:MAG: DUF933 domain-containing protein [Verrucomicrobiota bacterium]|nr:DUF933 domain-containing protein [Verrucomicrobiota bacterium]
MKIALLGMPQSGRKTLFNLLTGRAVPESRRPDETMEGVAPVGDPRVERLFDICRPPRKVYAENHFVLCPDVTFEPGKRKWIESAKRCDLLCLVIRAFQAEQVYHPKGSVDGARDRRALQVELLLADMEMADTRLTRIGKEKRAGVTPAMAAEETMLRKCMAALEQEKRLADVGLTPRELAPIRSLDFVTLLPELWVCNVDEANLKMNVGPNAVAVSCRIEQEIMGLGDPGERKEYLAAMGLSRSGLDRVNQAAYDALGLMSFYTIGDDEVRAWTIRKGSAAPAAGGKVHTDVERGFIRAEVMKYDDFVAAGSEQRVKDLGKMQLKGRDYVIEDGDICHFLFNV